MEKERVYLFFILCGYMLATQGTAEGTTPELQRTAYRFENYFLRAGQKRRGFIPPPKNDLVFAIQASDSVGRKGFNDSLQFAAAITEYFSFSTSTTRFALMTFSTNAIPVFDFLQYKNRDCLVNAIKNTRYQGGGTDLSAALVMAQHMFLGEQEGAREGATRTLVLITNGRSTAGKTPEAVAAVIKNSLYARIFVIGTGTKPDVTTLQMVTSASRYRHLYYLKDTSDMAEVMKVKMNLVKYTKCLASGSSHYDECQRHCQCVNGVLTNCCRVRKEFTSMRYHERATFVVAYKTLTTKEPHKSKYNKFIKVHEDLFGSKIHQKDQFLPWHRWYILEMENLLREVDCRVTIPYWAWSLWSHDPWNITDMWSDKYYGVGGNGVIDMQRFEACVQKGPFSKKEGGWVLPHGRCLERNFNGLPPDQVAVATSLDITDFTDFELNLRGNLHDLVHCLIDGTMCSFQAATAPEFFLHHGYVDKLWNEWQWKNKTNLNVFFPGVSGNMRQSPYERKDLLNLQNQPGCVKVCYAEPTINDANVVRPALSAASMATLTRILRRITSDVSQRARDLFKLTPEEAARCKALEELTHGSMTDSTLRLYGNEETLGFHLPSSLKTK